MLQLRHINRLSNRRRLEKTTCLPSLATSPFSSTICRSSRRSARPCRLKVDRQLQGRHDDHRCSDHWRPSCHTRFHRCSHRAASNRPVLVPSTPLHTRAARRRIAVRRQLHGDRRDTELRHRLDGATGTAAERPARESSPGGACRTCRRRLRQSVPCCGVTVSRRTEGSRLLNNGHVTATALLRYILVYIKGRIIRRQRHNCNSQTYFCTILRTRKDGTFQDDDTSYNIGSWQITYLLTYLPTYLLTYWIPSLKSLHSDRYLLTYSLHYESRWKKANRFWNLWTCTLDNYKFKFK